MGKKQGYRFGVEWIGMNDEPLERDPEVIATFISTALLADLYGKEPLEVAKDIERFRIKHDV
jgi:hypothetical protein